MNKSRFFVIAFLITGISLIGYLVFSRMGGHQQYYVNLAELEKIEQQIDGKGIRLNAKVVPGSIQKQPRKLIYDFAVTDGVRTVTVHYQGVVSDMFKDNVEVVVEGVYLAREKHIKASKLMTKCPSKYQAEKTPVASR